VLDGVGDELGAEEALDRVEQGLVGEEAEDGGADVQGRLRGDVLLGQADVEGLVEAPARLRAQREQPA
jgi:hypothetical protein